VHCAGKQRELRRAAPTVAGATQRQRCGSALSLEAALTSRTRLMLRASAGYTFGGAAEATLLGRQ